MSNKDREIKDSIQKLAGTYRVFPAKFIDCTVVSVDKPSRTCVVNAVNGECDNFTVRLLPEISDGELRIPSEDSTVCVCFTDISEPVIVDYSWLDEKTLIVGKQLHQILQDKQIFNKGEYGGIPIVKDPDNSEAGLLKRINDLEEQMNKLSGKWNDFCTNYIPGSPTVTGMPATLAAEMVLPDLIKTTEKDISNPNITHGKSL